MRYFLLSITFSTFIILSTGCQKERALSEGQIISERFIHKYGYDVSKKEWEKANYPGQVMTTFRNGVTIIESYTHGLLHGPKTATYPHSQVIKSKELYNKGHLIKKIFYDLRGTPEKEEEYISPSHKKVLRWYQKGTPMSVEHWNDNLLIDAEYYNETNDTLNRVIQGNGQRITRDTREKVIATETIENGAVIKKETVYPHGIPHTVISLKNGKENGQKQVFAPTGEPLSIENYIDGTLEGKATYYQNGFRYLEIDYVDGKKHGIERQFIDGDFLVEESHWARGQKHGPTTLFFDDMSTTSYYYNNNLVSKEKYRELCEIEENIAIMSERAYSKK